MWVTEQESLQRYGTVSYTGWDRESADQDFIAKGGTPGAFSATGADFVPGAGAFNFNWEQAEKDALEKLRPYYEEVLAEADYDISRAKTIIEEDYARGTRYNTEDLAVAQEGYAMAEPREKNELLTGLNQRGVLKSSIRDYEQQYLTDTQRRRREALQRSVDRQNEVMGIEKQRGIEDVTTKGTRYKRDLGEQKKERSLSLADLQYQRDYSRFLTEAGRFT